MIEIRTLRFFAALSLFALLAGLGCQSVRDDSSFPTLHPRKRALYTSVVLEPGGTKIQLASLTRQRIKQQFAAIGSDGSAIELEVELIADREAESLYGGTLVLRSSDGGWSSEHRLSPRSSGRWHFELEPVAHPLAWTSLRVEIEPDPYWEMDQQGPHRFRGRH
jgi:hypothetical protein